MILTKEDQIQQSQSMNRNMNKIITEKEAQLKQAKEARAATTRPSASGPVMVDEEDALGVCWLVYEKPAGLLVLTLPRPVPSTMSRRRAGSFFCSRALCYSLAHSQVQIAQFQLLQISQRGTCGPHTAEKAAMCSAVVSKWHRAPSSDASKTRRFARFKRSDSSVSDASWYAYMEHRGKS